MAHGGNDHNSAVAEIETQYGKGHQSAADLLDTQDANFDLKLQQALLKEVDQPATAALSVDDLDPQFGGTIQSFAVRGGRLVVVEDVNGRLEKWHTDIPSAAKKASKTGAVASAMPAKQETKTETQTGEPLATQPPPGANSPPPGPAADLEPAAPGEPDPAAPDISAAGTPTGEQPPQSEGDDGEAEGGDADAEGKAPKNVTVKMILAELEEQKIDPLDKTRKDDLWALLSEESHTKLSEAAGPES